MSINAIVSYDGTTTDDDALALASVLGEAGANLILAYVRHTAGQGGQARLEEDEAQALLDRGAAIVGNHAETRVVVHASTATGLRQLAEHEEAQLIVFGSAYRTPVGHIAPQKTTEGLLENGPVAIAIAPAGYQAREIRTLGLLAGLDDSAAIDTAHALASEFGATVSDETTNVDLLIVGSRPEAHDGRVLISARAENAIENTNSPVLVVPRGAPLSFRQAIYVA